MQNGGREQGDSGVFFFFGKLKMMGGRAGLMVCF